MENHQTVDTVPKASLEGLYHPAEETEQEVLVTKKHEEESKHDEWYD
jgi:hypothetical protein